MSIADDLRGGAEEDSATIEDILQELVRKRGLNYHTNVEKPDIMTAIDVYGEYMGKAVSPKVGALIKSSQTWDRTNMVPFKGNRANQIVEAVKARIDAQRNKYLQEQILGKATR